MNVTFCIMSLIFNLNERRTKNETSKTYQFFSNEITSRTLTPIAINLRDQAGSQKSHKEDIWI